MICREYIFYLRVDREVLEVKLLMIRIARGLEVHLDLVAALVLLVQKMLEWRLSFGVLSVDDLMQCMA
jgi:hypothetical protein